MAIRNRITTALLIAAISVIGGGLYHINTLLGEITLLKGYKQQAAQLLKKNRRLQSTLERNHVELEQQKKRLSATEKRLHTTETELENTNRKLARIEAEKPKGARKIARGASRIPVIGTIASVGLIAADAAQAAEACYREQEQCREDASRLYEEAKESAGRGAESANTWISEKVEETRAYFADSGDTAGSGAR